MMNEFIAKVLKSEMVYATGCTEPVAIALASAYATKQLSGAVEHAEVKVSGNIVKNAMSAGIPGTAFTGIEYAAAVGITGGDSTRALQVIDALTPEQIDKASALVKNGKIKVTLADTEEKLFIDVIVFGEIGSARAVIAKDHTNLILLEKNGEVVWKLGEDGFPDGFGVSPKEIASTLSVAKIYDFIVNMELDKVDLDIVKLSIKVNSAIAAAGLSGCYGLNLGKTMQEEMKKGIIGDDMVNRAMVLAAAAADARMAGANEPVVSNSGSGNQGIATTLPVVSFAKSLGASEETTLRAVTLSSLMTIYIKSKFGRLSALCGATVAGTACACAITYLLGGGLPEIENAIHNMMGNVTGMLCDGAKGDCALKIASCVNAAASSALLAMRNTRVGKKDGIVAQDVENTIENFCRLGNEGSGIMDKLILEIMLGK